MSGTCFFCKAVLLPGDEYAHHVCMTKATAERLATRGLSPDAEIHEQGNDGNGERGPAAGLGSESGQDDDGAGEKDEREAVDHD